MKTIPDMQKAITVLIRNDRFCRTLLKSLLKDAKPTDFKKDWKDVPVLGGTFTYEAFEKAWSDLLA
jgi:hypothetical protein